MVAKTASPATCARFWQMTDAVVPVSFFTRSFDIGFRYVAGGPGEHSGRVLTKTFVFESGA
jgi:hypothetical protein